MDTWKHKSMPMESGEKYLGQQNILYSLSELLTTRDFLKCDKKEYSMIRKYIIYRLFKSRNLSCS